MVDSRTVFVLTVGPDPARRVEVAEGESLSIGREASNDLQLAHRSVAPVHCRFENHRGVFRLVPVGRAPLAVDTRMVRGPTVLAGGETVRVGRIALGVNRAGRSLPGPVPQQASSRASVFGSSGRWPLKRLARRGRWFMISAVCHALLGAWLASLPFRDDRTAETEAIQISVWSDRVKPLEHEPPVDRLLRPDEEVTADVPEDLFDPPGNLMENPLRSPDHVMNAGDIIGAGHGNLPGLGPGGIGRSRFGAEFAGLLADLRGRGLDVVLVVDTTMSMSGVLSDVKRMMGALIGMLTHLVGNLQIGIVAYTDRGERCPTCSLDLTREPYRILNFVEDLRAEGGGDFEEAVDAGVALAVRDMGWRRRARKVILLIGDAPPRVDRVDTLRRTVSHFAEARGARRGESLVSTLFVVSEDRYTRRFRDEIAGAFRDIAERGGGDYAELDGQAIREQDLLDLVFGSSHRAELRRFVRGSRQNRRARIIEEHVRCSDRDWLLARLNAGHVQPALVEGLIDMADRSLLQRVAFLLKRSDRPASTRWAALYILKRVLGDPVAYDPEKPVWAQAESFRRILEMIGRFS